MRSRPRRAAALPGSGSQPSTPLVVPSSRAAGDELDASSLGIAEETLLAGIVPIQRLASVPLTAVRAQSRGSAAAGPGDRTRSLDRDTRTIAVAPNHKPATGVAIPYVSAAERAPGAFAGGLGVAWDSSYFGYWGALERSRLRVEGTWSKRLLGALARSTSCEGKGRAVCAARQLPDSRISGQ